MSYWWERAADISADGVVTVDEIEHQSRFGKSGAQAVTQALVDVGAAREADISLGGNVDRIDLPGIGLIQDQYTNAAHSEDDNRVLRTWSDWLISQAPTGGFSATTANADDAQRVTTGEKAAVQVGEDPAAVAQEIQQGVDRVTRTSSTSTNTGGRSTLVLGLIGAVAVAVAVLGGN